MSEPVFKMPDVNSLLMKSLEKELSQENLQEIFDKEVKRALEKTISDQFSWNGCAKKQLEEFFKDKTGIDTKQLPIPEYTKLVAKGFGNALKGLNEEKIIKEAETLMETILMSAPTKIKLSKIVKMWEEEIVDKFDYELRSATSYCDDEYEGEDRYKLFELNYIIEDRFPDSSCLEFCKTIMLSCEEIDDNSHRLVLDVNLSSEKEEKTCTLSSAHKDTKYGSEITNVDMADWSKLSNFHQLLYKIKSSGTTIVMDEDYIPEHIRVKLELTYE